MPRARLPILNFDQQTFVRPMPAATGWLLAACMEQRGQQELWIRRTPEVLAALRERAIIQSAESSNRIEGVTVPAARLRPLLQRKTAPRDRSEQELFGYRRALDWIFSREAALSLMPTVILHLHKLALPDLGDAGRFKLRDNEIIELLPTGGRRVRFRPTPADQTPAAIDELCLRINSPDFDQVPALLRVATATFDFLCIHPFRDGNGRLSRLLTTLLLDTTGFILPRYVSLERLIEESTEDYYRVLGECSDGWHLGQNEIVPWWNYFLGIIHRGYREFAEQVRVAGRRGGKRELIRAAILNRIDPFTLKDLKAELPDTSLPMIRLVLRELAAERKLKLKGRGRGAVWWPLSSRRTS